MPLSLPLHNPERYIFVDFSLQCFTTSFLIKQLVEQTTQSTTRNHIIKHSHPTRLYQSTPPTCIQELTPHLLLRHFSPVLLWLPLKDGITGMKVPADQKMLRDGETGVLRAALLSAQ